VEFARFFGRKDTLTFEVAVAALAVVVGILILDSAAWMTDPTTGRAVGWTLVALGPLNVFLSFLLSRPRQSGVMRAALTILKVVTMAVLAPVLAVVLLITALIVATLLSDHHESLP
jgi:hypothetical protein